MAILNTHKNERKGQKWCKFFLHLIKSARNITVTLNQPKTGFHLKAQFCAIIKVL